MASRRCRGRDPPGTSRGRCPEPEAEVGGWGGRGGGRRGAGGGGAAPRLPHTVPPGCVSACPSQAPPTPEGRWLERLLQEWEDECGEPPWYPEPVAEPESFAAWADRIAEEHRRRHCYRPPPPERAPPRAPPPARDESRLFWQRQREKEAQVGRARARRSAGGPKSTGGGLKPPQAAREPPKNTRDPPETAALLRFEDIPWPCPGGTRRQWHRRLFRGFPPPPMAPPAPTGASYGNNGPVGTPTVSPGSGAVACAPPTAPAPWPSPPPWHRPSTAALMPPRGNKRGGGGNHLSPPKTTPGAEIVGWGVLGRK
ncbi:NF-kappa-B inhibitor-like protein 1 isoform X2 [Buteo buteo]|uniref:NF-kappa-B inhibitor-like protein 1 isoform X2 n=1 Tax=Buteo buteo TaxID=30397 RepID=UPI003EBCB733